MNTDSVIIQGQLLTSTKLQSEKTLENSTHMASFITKVLVCVICPEEKSNTSSLQQVGGEGEGGGENYR